MQPIKDLIPKLSPPLESNSKTTGSPNQAPGPSSVIGPPPGEPGSKTTSVTMAAGLGRQMAANKPGQTDRVLEAWLTSFLGSKPEPQWSTRMNNQNWEGVITGFSLPWVCQSQKEEAIALVQKSLTPMTRTECIGLLGEIKLLTACRQSAGYDLEAQLSLYAKKLMDYPADVVRHVLGTQADISTWWPSWAELSERLELFANRRKRLLKAMQDWKEPESVEVTLPNGVILAINPWGGVDEVFAPKGTPQTRMGSDEALRLRAEVLASKKPLTMAG